MQLAFLCNSNEKDAPFSSVHLEGAKEVTWPRGAECHKTQTPSHQLPNGSMQGTTPSCKINA